MSIKRGEIIEVAIRDLASTGNGVARLPDGMTVFVEGALPGSRVKASVQRVKKRYAEALAAEVVERSPVEVKPECPHFPECGGCLLQHMDPAEQLAWKTRRVSDALERIGGLEDVPALTPIGSPDVWRYRNKMEFVYDSIDGQPVAGLRRRLDASVMPVPECRICTEKTAAILRRANELGPSLGRIAYNPKTGKGYLRRLVIRHHGTTSGEGELMVHLITATARDHSAAEKLGRALQADFPEITSFVHSTRKSRRDLAFGERIQQVIGQDSVEERLHLPDAEVRYRISPNAFFQPNSAAAELLYGAVRQAADPGPDDTVMDLYCGTGGLALALADKAKKVLGFELSKDSVRDAVRNAEINGFSNCEFHAGTLEHGLGQVKGVPDPDIIVTDPPRSGMHETVVRGILDMLPRRVVAVSCDPATLARDLGRLSHAYAVESVQAVDQFPHTTHVEAVAVLRRK